MSSPIVFNKDFDAKSIYVMKVYDAEVSKVWDYFTKAELIDQWWAPKPWMCKTDHLNFEEGGTWLYSMNGPEGEKMFGRVKYGEINQGRSFDGIDAFCDQNGNVDENFPQTKWLLGFTGVEEGTKLSVNMHFESEEDMTMQLEMGFEEGFKMGLNQLEELLK
ncbi:SRPBCC domain-containing protein [Chryseobacterium aquaticum]|uniref:SRPBCC domain-containing protein n=1 Tax=Chryseobacterium aquaticum TaxID=452084 RepID=A0A848N4Y9_9FLAO|nr:MULTISPECIES: SRPBCC domain-containing protein [Chryseobacterium]NMR33730.1 SRPBCC domain-containing protein [Chryseobacterium aquaticum]NRQ45805.1 SRPBCC domain-containing protein [Chryseobacterium sp. C-204]